MHCTLALVLLLCLVATPFVQADPGAGATPGLGTACGASENPKPCRGIIPTTNATTGTTTTYTGGWVQTGTVTVHPGATVTVIDASISVRNTSGGFVVLPGGTLRVIRSVFQEATNDAPYQLVAQPASTFVLNDSRIIGGEGVRIATATPEMSGNSLEGIALALRLDDVTANVHHNQFLQNAVAVNQTGGMPTLSHNRFIGGHTCIRDFQTDPTIVFNVFRDCHIGIWHEQSHSQLSDNDMQDSMLPPGSAMVIIGGLSPVIERNDIRNYGTGIKVIDARAYIRNNTIHDNLGDGILVDDNAAEMDIQGNLVENNGGAGIRVLRSNGIPIFNNVVRNNGDDGIVVNESTDIPLSGNVATANGGHGLRLFRSDGISVSGSSFLANAKDGVFLGGTTVTMSQVNASQNGRNGVTYDPMGPLNLLGPSPMTNLRAMANGGSGLLSVQGNLTSVTQGWFQGNTVAGVRNEDIGSAIDARNSYWGAPSGPTTPLNPLGTGDRVQGNVVFTPFRTTPPA